MVVAVSMTVTVAVAVAASAADFISVSDRSIGNDKDAVNDYDSSGHDSDSEKSMAVTLLLSTTLVKVTWCVLASRYATARIITGRH